jgi:quercetin dioxygenase-like cupin family protein
MSAKPSVIFPENYPQPFNIVGEQITILLTRNTTHGYEIFLQEGPEESGPPPHKHDWDESFYVIRGDIEFGYNDEQMTARPGTLVYLPGGTAHWFRFKEGGGQMISITGQGSDASQFFKDLGTEIPSAAPDIEKLLHIADRHGIDFIGD